MSITTPNHSFTVHTALGPISIRKPLPKKPQPKNLKVKRHLPKNHLKVKKPQRNDEAL